jgi:hypothetical protein
VSARLPALRWQRVLVAAVAFVIVVSTLGVALHSGTTMPYLRQLIDPDTVLRPLGLERWSRAVELAWTAASTLGAVLLVTAIAGVATRVQASRPSLAAFLFLPVVALGFLGFNLVVGLGFDRYLLLPLPFLVPTLIIGATASPRAMAVAMALVVAGAAGSALLVDQRVRSSTCEWDAAQVLFRSGIEATKINGGGAFNGYYAYDAIMRDPSRRKNGPPAPWIQPRAEFLVTPLVATNAWMTPVSSTRCPNLPGFRETELHTYRCPPSPVPGPPTACQPFLP